MPTIIRESGFNVKINIDDHEPMHVHIWYQGRQVLITYEDEVSIRRNYGLNRRELRQALTIVKKHQLLLQDEWRKIHGQENR